MNHKICYVQTSFSCHLNVVFF
uniref:Uncharacterized protein n=1 Tax=Anguilla anguilla TaxID=7936 RepID=A0A0E9PA04_ANGAN